MPGHKPHSSLKKITFSVLPWSLAAGPAFADTSIGQNLPTLYPHSATRLHSTAYHREKMAVSARESFTKWQQANQRLYLQQGAFYTEPSAGQFWAPSLRGSVCFDPYRFLSKRQPKMGTAAATQTFYREVTAHPSRLHQVLGPSLFPGLHQQSLL